MKFTAPAAASRRGRVGQGQPSGLDVKPMQGANVSLDKTCGSQAEVGCHRAPI